ncbi:MAG: Gfo/Idh/MocA family oxidoreductase [Gemmatimonadota bacterium]|nr:Gfo/Idh/MocA family oxidoreductase [Gemmatimonadota bacterium]
MSHTYRVGVIGFAHMHVNNVAALFAQHSQVDMVACADTVPTVPELRDAPYTRGWNMKNALNAIGIPKAYEDYREMLAKEALDIAICTTENARHPEVVAACAQANAHVCVEKPMAMSMSDALQMARACEAAGVTMAVNWPITWRPAARKAKELIDQGVIGRVLEVRWRGGHRGPLGAGVSHAGVSGGAEAMNERELGATWWHRASDGGGAMLDFCSYGALVARWYIGEPGVSAIGMRANLNSPWGDADDNGVMIVRFSRAMGVFAGTWTTRHQGVPNGPIVYGTKGTLVAGGGRGKPTVQVEADESATYSCERLPQGRRQISEELIHHLDTGEPLHETLQVGMNLDATAIVDAGIRSADSGKLEPVNGPDWAIG